MTRINLINVTELTDQHLLAEHREIKRIPNLIKSGKYDLKGQPKEFTLGTGHVKFFYNKLLFLKKRYLQIYDECLKRGFEIQNYMDCFYLDLIKFTNSEMINFFNDYNPTQEEIEISRKRIQEKVNQKPLFYKYYGKKI